jgi:trehalose 6-phosphate phosphatase
VSASDVGPVTAADPVALAHRILSGLPTGGRPLLALDHDGTLSPIAPTPDAAMLAPGARPALVRLVDDAEVAIVSGRALADLEARLGDLPITLVAEHGLRVRAPDGSQHVLADAPSVTELAWLRARLADLLHGQAGWLVEDKGVGIAVHHRMAGPGDADDGVFARLHAAVHESLTEAAGRGGGAVQEGSAVLELRAAGADKGSALRWLADRTAARPVVMVGDDMTDEAAFVAATALEGWAVLVAPEPRPSAATERLDDPAAAVRLLEALADGLASR